MWSTLTHNLQQILHIWYQSTGYSWQRNIENYPPPRTIDLLSLVDLSSRYTYSNNPFSFSSHHQPPSLIQRPTVLVDLPARYPSSNDPLSSVSAFMWYFHLFQWSFQPMATSSNLPSTDLQNGGYGIGIQHLMCQTTLPHSTMTACPMMRSPTLNDPN